MWSAYGPLGRLVEDEKVASVGGSDPAQDIYLPYVVNDITTFFTLLVGIYFPSVTGETPIKVTLTHFFCLPARPVLPQAEVCVQQHWCCFQTGRSNERHVLLFTHFYRSIVRAEDGFYVGKYFLGYMMKLFQSSNDTKPVQIGPRWVFKCLLLLLQYLVFFLVN